MNRFRGFDPNRTFGEMLDSMKFTSKPEWPNPYYSCPKKVGWLVCGMNHSPEAPCPVKK